jgi:hypothetical protein
MLRLSGLVLHVRRVAERLLSLDERERGSEPVLAVYDEVFHRD